MRINGIAARQNILIILKKDGIVGHGYLGKKGKRYQHPKFGPAIKKYGWKNFDHYILGYYTIDKIDSAEKYWIKKKNSLKEGYNASPGGQKTKIFTEETKEKLSLSSKGRYTGSKNPMFGKPGTRLGIPMSEETKRKISNSLKNNGNLKFCVHYGKDNVTSKAVVAVDIYTGKLLKKFDCVDDAGRVFNAINGSSISACCKGKRYSSYGFKWKYYENDDIIEGISIEELLKFKVDGKPGLKGLKKGKYNISEKYDPIIAYKKDDPNWNKEFKNKKELAEELNLKIPNIDCVLRGERKYTKGYSFKKKD